MTSQQLTMLFQLGLPALVTINCVAFMTLAVRRHRRVHQTGNPNQGDWFNLLLSPTALWAVLTPGLTWVAVVATIGIILAIRLDLAANKRPAFDSA